MSGCWTSPFSRFWLVRQRQVTNIPAQISARGHRTSPFSEMNSSKDRLTSFPPPRIGRVHFAIGRVHFDVSHWLGPTFQAHAQSSCYKVRQQSSHHRQMQPKRRDWISCCVSTNIENYTMETCDISDDRTVSVVQVQDGEKMVIIKENGSLVKFIDLTPSRWAEYLVLFYICVHSSTVSLTFDIRMESHTFLLPAVTQDQVSYTNMWILN